MSPDFHPTTPPPELPQILDICPTSSVLPHDFCAMEGNKNISAAFNTPLVTEYSQVNNSHLAADPYPESFLGIQGLSMTPEIPFPNPPQLPEVEQDNLFGIGLPAQSVSTMSYEASDLELENFLVQLNDSQTEGTSVSTLPSISTSMIQAATSHPPYVDQYGPVASLLSNADGYGHTANYATYKPYLYATAEGVSFDTQPSQPYSFATPDMGIYPQVVSQSNLYNTPVWDSLPMHYLF